MRRLRRRAAARLGELEAEVMRVVWQKGHATVQEVKDALEGDRAPAYTTVMTVMSRLAEKGLLARHKEGRAYVYAAIPEKRELAGSLLRALVRRLYGGSGAHAIAHLLETDEDLDEAELARLEELIRKKRRERA